MYPADNIPRLQVSMERLFYHGYEACWNRWYYTDRSHKEQKEM